MRRATSPTPSPTITRSITTSAWAGGYLERYLGLRGLFIAGGVAVLLALLILRPSRRVDGAKDPAEAPERESGSPAA